MGRTYWNKKQTVESCLDISINWLKKHGYLTENKCGGITWTTNGGDKTSVSVSTSLGRFNYLSLSYASNNNNIQENFDYDIQLLSTPCNYGGKRYWFHCPLESNGHKCRRRVAILYLPPGEKYFGCRHCYKLTYRIRNLGRGKLRHLHNLFNYIDNYEVLRQEARREVYAGKITRKYKRYEKLSMKCRLSTKVLQALNQ